MVYLHLARIRAAVYDRRVVFAAGLVSGCLLTGWVAPILDRVHISLDGPERVVYGDFEAEDEAVLADESLGRLSEDELAALDVVEVSDPEVPAGVPSGLSKPAKRAKRREVAKPAQPASMGIIQAKVERVVMTEKEQEKDAYRSAYIWQYAPVARAASTSKVPASYLLACALVKGGSEYSLKANNHFDVRCNSRRCADGHCLRSDADDQHKWFFTRYKSAADSYKAQAKALGGKRLPESAEIDRIIKIYSLQNLDK